MFLARKECFAGRSRDERKRLAFSVLRLGFFYFFMATCAILTLLHFLSTYLYFNNPDVLFFLDFCRVLLPFAFLTFESAIFVHIHTYIDDVVTDRHILWYRIFSFLVFVYVFLFLSFLLVLFMHFTDSHFLITLLKILMSVNFFFLISVFLSIFTEPKEQLRARLSR